MWESQSPFSTVYLLHPLLSRVGEAVLGLPKRAYTRDETQPTSLLQTAIKNSNRTLHETVAPDIHLGVACRADFCSRFEVV